ncbi:MAG: sigma-70 family RNA polymerase sigma factor [Pseudomonadota bacterium]
MSESPDTLGSLILRCNRGERLAWEEFYGRYSGLVSRAVKRLGAGDPNETEDLVQEVFIHLFSALRKYDRTRPIETYILEIARRVRISRYRKNTAAKRGGGVGGMMPLDAHDGGEGGFVMIPSRENDPEEALIGAQQTGLMRRAVKTLTENCRKLLAMRYDKGLSFREISEALDVREGTLRVRVQRCLSSLARSYGELAAEEGGTP